MYENIVDVLIYIYENYMDGETPPPADPLTLKDELSEAGFSSTEIEKAFNWMDQLAVNLEQFAQPVASQPQSMRIFTPDECERLDLEARGFLLGLEQQGILDPVNRELVIEQAMALETETIDAGDLQWITLLVLMNQPGQEFACNHMEELIYDHQSIIVH